MNYLTEKTIYKLRRQDYSGYFNIGITNDLTVKEKSKIDVLTKNSFTNKEKAIETHRHKYLVEIVIITFVVNAIHRRRFSDLYLYNAHK